ncbi:heterokaryon incompatibility protein-domain-containing protein [Rostrohypoxylon terebratum]|nr:heterokaryon incompatibility protein-domain-containing protein [Rostrohypoxylon terebratum]
MANVSSYGELCTVCITTLREGCQSTFGKILPHHQRYQDFVTSKDNGCYICAWLWEKHKPPPLTQKYNKDYKYEITYHKLNREDVSFNIQCDWAAPVELHVNISRGYQEQHVHNMAYPWCDLSLDIGSDQSLDKIKYWIESCQRDHQSCRFIRSGRTPFFPARIIDVSRAGSGVVSLRNREEVIIRHLRRSVLDTSDCRLAQCPPYWTLSHRWGVPGKVKQLLQATESELHEGFYLDEISPTFRDASLLVHRLGYKHIWIDSLCIFQDSTSDWHRAVDTMAEIYQHSFCNISAISSSVDPESTGLLGRRKLDTRLLYPFEADLQFPDDSGCVRICNSSIWDDDVEGAPLNKRGWVVQERFLAGRRLHFTENQIYWECSDSVRCESDYLASLHTLRRRQSRPPIGWGYRFPMLEMAGMKLSTAIRLPQQTYDLFTNKHWSAIVSNYTSCKLTKESDRLVAISGIAKIFQNFNGDTYLAGLWKNRLHFYLGWTVVKHQGRRNFFAPSWSWASMTGDSMEFGQTKQDVYSLIRLLDARIPSDRDMTRSTFVAELEITCKLCRFERRNDKELIIENHGTGYSRVFSVDNSPFDVFQYQKGACIPISWWKDSDTSTSSVKFLLLVKCVSDEPRQFVRRKWLEANLIAKVLRRGARRNSVEREQYVLEILEMMFERIGCVVLNLPMDRYPNEQQEIMNNMEDSQIILV